jgi:hypothetical protein
LLLLLSPPPPPLSFDHTDSFNTFRISIGGAPILEIVVVVVVVATVVYFFVIATVIYLFGHFLLLLILANATYKVQLINSVTVQN